MFCKKCGTELDDEAVFCPKCGVATDNYQKPTNSAQTTQNVPQGNGMAIAGFVCSFFFPILGWIFGGIGLSRAKQRGGKGFAIAALAIASAVFLIGLALTA